MLLKWSTCGEMFAPGLRPAGVCTQMGSPNLTANTPTTEDSQHRCRSLSFLRPHQGLLQVRRPFVCLLCAHAHTKNPGHLSAEPSSACTDFEKCVSAFYNRGAGCSKWVRREEGTCRGTWDDDCRENKDFPSATLLQNTVISSFAIVCLQHWTPCTVKSAVKSPSSFKRRTCSSQSLTSKVGVRYPVIVISWRLDQGLTTSTCFGKEAQLTNDQITKTEQLAARSFRLLDCRIGIFFQVNNCGVFLSLKMKQNCDITSQRDFITLVPAHAATEKKM